jgi:hypothetical protein
MKRWHDGMMKAEKKRNVVREVREETTHTVPFFGVCCVGFFGGRDTSLSSINDATSFHVGGIRRHKFK